MKSSKIAGATSLADLKDAKLGAQVGTTSYQAITDVDQADGASRRSTTTTTTPRRRCRTAQIDGLVVDLPTAFYITGAEIDDATIVGQLPQPSGTPEQFGLVLDKGSPLTACVSQARRRARAPTARSTQLREAVARRRSRGAPMLPE